MIALLTRIPFLVHNISRLAQASQPSIFYWLALVPHLIRDIIAGSDTTPSTGYHLVGLSTMSDTCLIFLDSLSELNYFFNHMGHVHALF